VRDERRETRDERRETRDERRETRDERRYVYVYTCIWYGIEMYLVYEHRLQMATAYSRVAPISADGHLDDFTVLPRRPRSDRMGQNVRRPRSALQRQTNPFQSSFARPV